MTERTEPGMALVSGGSRGIGRATVLRLAEDGHDISFCYRSAETDAEQVRKEVEALGRRALATAVDVTDAAAVRAWVKRSERELGPATVAVTSAGITRDKPLVLMSDEDWHCVLDTNLDGTYHVFRAAVFGMLKRRKGSLIALSSVSGVHGNPTQSNYSASKAGIIGFTKALAKEVGGYGIRANVVAPGLVETDMTGQLGERAAEALLARVPLGRLGRPEEVADLIGYLASDRAAYVTGSVFEINGGLTV